MFGDWSHNSAFEDYGAELRDPPAKMQTVILNGKGMKPLHKALQAR